MSFSKIHEFKNPTLKHDEFHGTHGTHANGATANMYVFEAFL